MAALTAGTQAPDFTLSTVEGKTVALAEALQQAPILLAFFKVSCPTCQYTFPFLERLHQAYPELQILGVSQNNKKETGAFIKEFGVTFPILLDETPGYPVSNAYGLTNVPSIFWIGQDSKIELSSVGWAKQDVEDINQMIADLLHQKPVPIFRADESIAAFRAG